MKSTEFNFGRRSFIKTSGLAVAGLGLPIAAQTETRPANAGNRTDRDAVRQLLPAETYQVDYVVVGGGIAGVCSAITAARAGLKTVLVQDRPVPGGNASSEVRLWILGATCHMSSNNRWAREGGVLEELLVENMYRNREGNPVFFDALLLEKIWAEPKDAAGHTLYETSDNHHSRNEIRLEKPVLTSSLTLECYRAHEKVPISVFGIQVY
jgi:hypothetical protein